MIPELRKLKHTGSGNFFLLAGPCVIEDTTMAFPIAERLCKISDKLNIPLVFKASFKKANRTRVDSFMGIGDENALKILEKVGEQFDIPVVTDIHTSDDAKRASQYVDILQIPAFLCRQTDLVGSIARSGVPVNIKKAQFMSPTDIENVINKFKSFGNNQLLLCERGTSFGYNNLVVDMIGLASLKAYNHPVIFDVTHSLQKPGGLGDKTAGRRESVLDLAKSGMALGLAGLFLEVHPDPDKAMCDGPCALPLTNLKELLLQIKSLDALVKSFKTVDLN